MAELLKPEAVLFDMDGTLTDTEKLWFQAEQDILGEFGCSITQDQANSYIGKALLHVAQSMIDDFAVNISAEELAQKLSSRVVELAQTKGIPWRPGAVELLENLVNWHIPTALVTSSVYDFAKLTVNQAPKGSLEVMVTSESTRIGKPDPMPYLFAAHKLGVEIKNCVVFEDSIPGFTSGARSGAVTVGVPFQVELPRIPGTYFLESLVKVDFETLSQLATRTYESEI